MSPLIEDRASANPSLDRRISPLCHASAVRREHPRRRSLDQVVAAFLSDCRARNLSPRTVEQYDWAIRNFRAYLGTAHENQVLAELNAESVRVWADALRATRRPTSVRSAVRALKVFSAWLPREGYARSDPLATVRLPRAPAPLILPLSAGQVVALMDAGPPVLRGAIAVLADTGLRASELCGLRVDDVRENFLRVIGKGGRERLVPYGATAATELTRYVSRARHAPVVLTRPAEPPPTAPLPTGVSHEPKRAGARAGLSVG